MNWLITLLIDINWVFVCMRVFACLRIFPTYEFKLSSLTYFFFKVSFSKGFIFSCRIQMYLNQSFHSNPLLSSYHILKVRYFTISFLKIFLLSELAEYEPGFLLNLLITTICENSNLFPPSLFVSISFIPYPCYFAFLFIFVSIPLWESQENPVIVKLPGKSFNIWYIFKVRWFTSLLQCVSVTDFFSRNSFESPTNNMCCKVILKFFYLPKVILELHLGGNYKSLCYIISTIKETLVPAKLSGL